MDIVKSLLNGCCRHVYLIGGKWGGWGGGGGGGWCYTASLTMVTVIICFLQMYAEDRTEQAISYLKKAREAAKEGALPGREGGWEGQEGIPVVEVEGREGGRKRE